jgi:hypothetical protein
LVGAALGAVTCLVAAVVPLFFLGIALGHEREGWVGVVTGIVTGVMVIAPVALAVVAVPLLRKVRVAPVWGVALISPVATGALASCVVALSGLDRYVALLGAPVFAAGGYAMGALITMPGLQRRWSVLLAGVTAALLVLAIVISAV